MAGYIRQDTTNNIANGNIINANDLDNEYDAIAAAFGAITGHKHDGTDAEGAPITKVGPVQDVVVSSTAVTPKTDNTVDLGSSSNEFKDLYIDGVANIDSLVADTADVSGDLTIADKIVHAGDTNTAVRFPAADTVTIETDGVERVRVDSAGNVGVGTASPSTKIHAAGTTSNVLSYYSNTGGSLFVGLEGSSAGSSFTGSSSYASVVVSNSQPLQFGTQNVIKMTLDTNGNLGLGVTPSAWGGSAKALEFSGGSVVGFGTGSLEYWYNAYNNGTNTVYKFSGTGAMQYKQTGTGHAWYTAPSGTAGNPISFTQAMTLDASGRLGVGTTSPNARLEIVEYNNSESGNSAAIIIKSDHGLGEDMSISKLIFAGANRPNGFAKISASGSDYSGGNGNMRFYTATGGALTERARIDSIGNLLVGTNNAGANNSNSIQINPGIGAVGVQHASGTASGVVYLQFNYAASGVGSITQNGTTSVAYNTSSDYRLKHDIAPMQGALARVQQLKPVTYKWNADGSDGEGFIAHELAEVCPQAVTGEKDAVDADGKPVYQGIDTSFLVATLTAAIQEQQKMIEEQRGVIDSLTTRIEALEAK